MKKYSFSLIICICISINVFAQVDRTKMPTPGPVPTLNLAEPHEMILDNGLTVLIVENHKLPRVSISLSLDTPPHIEGNKAGVSSIVSQIMGKGTLSVPKDQFNEEVDFIGAFFNIGIDGGYAQALSKYTEKIFTLFSDAALHPNFTEQELNLEKKKIIESLKSGKNSAATVASRVTNALAYGKGHPKGEFATEETINSITLDDVKTYYRNYFVPSSAYMVISGDISIEQAQILVQKHFVTWKAAKAPSFGIPPVVDAQYRQINFINMPNAVQTELAVMNITNLKMADKDYHAALIANYILGGSFGSYINMNLREKNGYTYGARSILPVNKHYKSAFRAYTKVRNMVTDSAVIEILNEVKRIRTEEVDDNILKNAKAKFLGDFILASESDRTSAVRSIEIKTQDLPKDFYKTFISKINAVTKADVQRVATTYFDLKNARIVLVGKASEVLPNLEKISFENKKIPILYFDAYGNKTEKPKLTAATPSGITAQTVLNSYFTALGGKDKLKKISSVYVKAEAAFNGAILGLSSKTTNKNQSAIEVSFGGMTVQKVIFNGATGYAMNQGKRIEYNEEQIAMAKKESYPFAEINYNNAEFDKTEPYKDGTVYVLKLDEDKTSYFDSATGLKVKETTNRNQDGSKIAITVMYDDYQEVDGIQFPFTISQSLGPQTIDFKVKEILLNEKVSEEDFN
ncbi:insulinase family protein [Aquimarina sp. W85]|uniref:insulinase family protein n=1 Tax=Aquimarina rhodophyticola TaxID=3342246 RepID=UPI0036725194